MGADIVETNTFNATAVTMDEYGLGHLCFEINAAAAACARRAADRVMDQTGRPRWVAGVLGPTNKTASISPDVNDPGQRNVTFAQLVASYDEAARGLIDGGADILLVETIFDTLNAKAAVYALEALFERTGERLPVMISGTITDASGRTLSGQTTEAFWNSLRHAKPLSIGLNCALGAEELRQYVDTLSRVANVHVSAWPNAGLPNELRGVRRHTGTHGRADPRVGGERPAQHRGGLLWVDAAHIEAICKTVAGLEPPVPTPTPSMHLSGLEPVEIGESQRLFVNIGERTNVTGSARFGS